VADTAEDITQAAFHVAGTLVLALPFEHEVTPIAVLYRLIAREATLTDRGGHPHAGLAYARRPRLPKEPHNGRSGLHLSQ
jgi:hypothetical protein